MRSKQKPRVIQEPQTVAVKSARFSKRQLLIGAVCAIVLVMCLTGGILYHQAKKRAAEMEQRQIAQKKYEQTRLSSSAFLARKQYDQAIKILQEYLAQTPTEEYRTDAMFALGDTNMTAERPAEGKKWYEIAMQQSGVRTFGVVHALAQASDDAGNTQDAIKYYKESAALRSKSKDVTVQQEVVQFNNRIRVLGGQS